MNEWLPIESAPRDGTRIDLWFAGPRNTGDRRPDCRFGDGMWLCDYGDQGDGDARFYIDDEATHWMPLPSPPTDRRTPEGE